MKLFNLPFFLLLKVIHITISAIQVISSWLEEFFSLSWIRASSTEKLFSVADFVEKVPKHLCFAVVEDVSKDDVAKLIAWAMMAGIPEISVWDAEGELQRNAKELKLAIQREYRKTNATVPSILLCIPNVLYEEGTGFRINLWLQDNGRTDIVNVCAPIHHYLFLLPYSLLQGCKLYCQKDEKRLDPLDPEKFSEFLAVKSLTPDLVLKCGSIESMCGFMPWQLRVAEFGFIQSHKGVKLDTFLTCLHKYGNCSRRFGK
eukprot:m.27305 g.27305  ORF g.27305 m.27305 type:complete len:259 (-) comp7883_c0_seq1:117-893(-)